MHLSEYDMARYLDGVVAPDERAQIEEHLEACAACRTNVAGAFRVLEAVPQEPAPPLDDAVQERAVDLVADPSSSDPARRVRGMTVWRYAAAAVLVLALGVGAWMTLRPSGAPDRFRAEGAAGGVVLLAPEDGATVAESPTLRWQPWGAALAYRVSIYDPDGTVVWHADTTAHRVDVPASLSCRAGDAYFWSVEVLLEDGTARGSALHAFSCTP